MADKQARVEISTEGAERAAAAARTALNPWIEYAGKAQTAFSSFRGAVGNAVGGVLQDLGRVVTVGSSISFVGAVQQVQSLEKSVSQLAVASGKTFEPMKQEILAISEKLKTQPEQIASFIAGAGRATYGFEKPRKDLEAFLAFARETGRELGETGPLAAAAERGGFKKWTEALDQIRDNAQQLGTAGGTAALADQFTKFAGTLDRTSNSGKQLVAILAQIAQGAATPQQAEQRQAAILGSFSDAGTWRAHFKAQYGVDLIDQKTGKFDQSRAMEIAQQDLRKMGRGRALNVAAGWFGGNFEAAARFIDMDMTRDKALAAGSRGTDALIRHQATPGGQAEADAAALQRNMQDMLGHGSALGSGREALRGFTANNPLLGAAADFAISAGLGSLGSVLTGGTGGKESGKTFGDLLQVGALFKGAKYAKGAVDLSKAARALGVADEFTGSLLTGAGSGAGFAAAGASGIAASLAALGFATAPLNERRGQIEGEQLASFERRREGRARALIRAGERSGGTEAGFIHEVGAPLLAAAGYDPTGKPSSKLASVSDPVLASLFQQLREGSPELKGLPKNIADAVQSALIKSPLQIQVINQTGGDVEVTQSGGAQ